MTNSIDCNSPWPLRGALLLAALLLGHAAYGLAQDADAPEPRDPDKVWEETRQAFTPPAPPAEWRERRPTQEEVASFREQQGKLAAVAAERARVFYETYPEHNEAATAREKEMELIRIAAQLGNTNVQSRLDELVEQQLTDPNLSEDERFKLRARTMERKAMASGGQDRDLIMSELEKGARELLGEFPTRAEPYLMLLQLAGDDDPEKAMSMAREVLDSDAPEAAREAAQAALNKFEALGQPLDIQFAALDGRAVDLSTFTGKVVLIDFWATWCGPCIAELPNVKAAYNQLHPKGFEIVGISFDTEKEKLESFVAKEDMPWPQYFDGKGWENDIGRRFGINSIPSMWLLNKQGVLVDMNARNDLQAKVERLLAE